MKGGLVNEMKAQTPNVRFWEWINNGWVKLTLTPNKEHIHRTYSPDEEGYSYSNTSYSIGEDGYIYREWENGGRDCDGPISRRGCDKCKISEVALVPAHPANGREDMFQGKLIHRPHWTEYRKTRVHDAYAAAMNY